jgi:hypothetical protein
MYKASSISNVWIYKEGLEAKINLEWRKLVIEKMSQCQFAHRKSHVGWAVRKSGPQWWEAGD